MRAGHQRLECTQFRGAGWGDIALRIPPRRLMKAESVREDAVALSEQTPPESFAWVYALTVRIIAVSFRDSRRSPLPPAP